MNKEEYSLLKDIEDKRDSYSDNIPGYVMFIWIITGYLIYYFLTK